MRLEFMFQLFMICVFRSENLIRDLCKFTVDTSTYFVWNKDQLSPLEFQLSLCALRCNGTDIVDVGKERNQTLSKYECKYCHCRRPSCEKSDTCCPDVSATRPTPHLAVGDIKKENTKQSFNMFDEVSIQNIRLDLGCFMNKKPFPIERTCLPDYQDNVTVEYLCEDDLPIEEQTLETYIKVLDNSTHVVYKNRFCALCNRVSQ
ncbi:hypothetical protein BgiMline_006357, partial [Biomphalaria glabrata]